MECLDTWGRETPGKTHKTGFSLSKRVPNRIAPMLCSNVGPVPGSALWEYVACTVTLRVQARTWASLAKAYPSTDVVSMKNNYTDIWVLKQWYTPWEWAIWLNCKVLLTLDVAPPQKTSCILLKKKGQRTQPKLYRKLYLFSGIWGRARQSMSLGSGPTSFCMINWPENTGAKASSGSRKGSQREFKCCASNVFQLCETPVKFWGPLQSSLLGHMPGTWL